MKRIKRKAVAQNKNISRDSNIKQVTMAFEIPMKIPMGMAIVNIDEYEYLKQDNARLRETILKLSSDKELMEKIIDNHKQTIEELRKENAELKNKINEMEKDIALLKQENKKIHLMFDRYVAKQMVSKYIIAIQDVNDLFQLEHNLDLQNAGKIYDLHQNRIGDCHYIYKNDAHDVVNEKIKILHKKLGSMSKIAVKIMKKNYGTLDDAVKKYIEEHHNLAIQCNLSTDDIDEINEWWDDDI